VTSFTILWLSGMLSGYLDAHPELLLELKCQRRPGESPVRHIERELARLDAVMQRMFAKRAKRNAQFDVIMRSGADLVKTALEAETKRKAEAEALKALGGGIADHPKASFTFKPSPERVKADAERRAKQEKAIAELEADLMTKAAKDPAYQKILDDFREDIRKAREVGTTKPGK
jgi:hypothetical protein